MVGRCRRAGTRSRRERPNARATRSCERALDREFPVICFAWDGTAVARRDADASAVRSRVERLAALGVDIAVVSSADVARRGRPAARAPRRGGPALPLPLAGLGDLRRRPGRPAPARAPRGQRRSRRSSSPPRPRRCCDRLTAAGLEVVLVQDHLNRLSDRPGARTGRSRRGPRWPTCSARSTRACAPPASATACDECMELARELGREAGLAHPAITQRRPPHRHRPHRQERRHARGDARARHGPRSPAAGPARARRHLRARGGRAGHRLGHADPGAAPRRLRQRRRGAGRRAAAGAARRRRPGRVPRHPARPARDARDRRAAELPGADADPAWRFEVKGFDPFREREVETWLTVANGETRHARRARGGLGRSRRRPPSSPASTATGPATRPSASRSPRRTGPACGSWWPAASMTLSNGEILDHERVLDMRHGIVFRSWRQRLRSGRRVRVRTARFASLADRQVMAARAEATPRGLLRLASSGRAPSASRTPAGRPRRREFEVLDDPPGLIASTRGRNGGGHVLAVTTKPAPGSPVARTPQQARDVIGGRLEPGDPATVDRLAAIVSARTKVPSPEVARRGPAAGARQLGYDELLRRHRAAWDAALGRRRPARRRRRRRPARAALRHLPHDQHGASHQGHRLGRRPRPGRHVLLPARLLGHRDLRAALLHLHAAGDGAHAAQVPLPQPAGRAAEGRADGVPRRALPVGVGRQGHRDDAALRLRPERRAGPHPLRPHGAPHLRRTSPGATWEYWKATGDDAFMASMGVEIMLETARFWVVARGARRRGALPRARRRGPGRVPRGRGRQRLHQRARALEHQARARGARLAGDGGRGVRRRAQEAARAHRHRALRLARGRRRLRGRLRPGDAALRAVRRVLRHGRRADREAPAAADGGRPAARPRRHAASARWSSRPTS